MATTEPYPTSSDESDQPAARQAAHGRDRVRVQAARLRLVTDRKLDKTTPEWVKRLAGRPSS